MANDVKISIFDTEQLSKEHPISPEGYLFTYYPSETAQNLHYHDFFEIGYCERGSGVFYVDGELVPFNGKCASIMYPYQSHIAQSLNPDKSLWHFLYIDLDYLFSQSEFADIQFLKQMKFNSFSEYTFPSILPHDQFPDLNHLCEMIINEAALFPKDALVTIQALTYALLTKHERLFINKEEKDLLTGKKSPLLYRELGPVLNYINSNYTDAIEIDELLKIAKMSKSNLQRKMIAFTGMAPAQYVHHLRMRYATALLLDKRKSISEIADEVGYNLSSFNRQFMKKYKMTPSDWRNQNAK